MRDVPLQHQVGTTARAFSFSICRAVIAVRMFHASIAKWMANLTAGLSAGLSPMSLSQFAQAKDDLRKMETEGA
jgi:hypothetical protein